MNTPKTTPRKGYKDFSPAHPVRDAARDASITVGTLFAVVMPLWGVLVLLGAVWEAIF